MTRNRLPQRRGNITVEFVYPPDQAANGHRFVATLGATPAGEIGEIFLRTGKSEAMMESIARDLAVVASIALQHGASIDEIKSALTKLSDRRPAGPLGVLFEVIEQRKSVGVGFEGCGP